MRGKIVSVIVPVYDAENTLESCIESLLTLEYPKKSLEIIFINNNSTDSSANILNEYKDKIRILEETKKGASAARNKGIKESIGHIIAFTDSDCIVDKNWLKNIISPFFESDNELIGVVAGKIKTMKPCNYIALSGDLIHDHHKAVNYEIPYAISMNWASRKDVLNNVGLFDEDFIRAQDSELSLRIFKSGYKLLYNENAVVYHKNPDSFRGLYRKGYLSGFYGRKVFEKHKEFINQIDNKSSNQKFFSIFSSIIRNYFKNESYLNLLCLTVYHFGRFNGMLLSKFKN